MLPLIVSLWQVVNPYTLHLLHLSIGKSINRLLVAAPNVIVFLFLAVSLGGDRGHSGVCLQDLALPHHPVFWEPRGLVSHFKSRVQSSQSDCRPYRSALSSIGSTNQSCWKLPLVVLSLSGSEGAFLGKKNIHIQCLSMIEETFTMCVSVFVFWCVRPLPDRSSRRRWQSTAGQYLETHYWQNLWRNILWVHETHTHTRAHTHAHTLFGALTF